jgi:hypothetical protein
MTDAVPLSRGESKVSATVTTEASISAADDSTEPRAVTTSESSVAATAKVELTSKASAASESALASYPPR